MSMKTIDFRESNTERMRVPKDRYTFLLCTNMSGTDKMKMLVIGKSKTPRCYKDIKNLQVHYFLNKSSNKYFDQAFQVKFA